MIILNIVLKIVFFGHLKRHGTEILMRPKSMMNMQMSKITGIVVVKMVVTKEGTAADPVVVKSSPEGVFDAAAIEAVKNTSLNQVQ